MTKDAFLRAILDSPGLDEMKAVVQKWDRVAEGLDAHRGSDTPMLPDLLWLTRPGAGKTTLLRMLADYLDAARLMDFYGDVRFFEFMLEYCPPTQPLDELGRLVAEIGDAAGFRNQYHGMVALDISQWTGHFSEAYFRRIMELVASVDDQICFIFVLEGATDAEALLAERLLHAYCRVTRVRIPYPTAKVFAAYCRRYLSTFGLAVDDGAEALLRDAVRQLREGEYFDGYKTVNRLCQDIAFELRARGTADGEPVGAEALSDYRQGSEYISNLCEVTRMRQIGFGGEDE